MEKTADPPFQGNLTIIWETEKQALLERCEKLGARIEDFAQRLDALEASLKGEGTARRTTCVIPMISQLSDEALGALYVRLKYQQIEVSSTQGAEATDAQLKAVTNELAKRKTTVLMSPLSPSGQSPQGTT